VFKLSPPTAPGGNWTETVLYAFTGGADGWLPLAGLIRDSAGVLYGTTAAGGTFGGADCLNIGCGTVFSLTPPAAGQTKWTETVLHAFAGPPDGLAPLGSVTIDEAGTLYGTTEFGGFEHSGGTVFQLAPPPAGATTWTETVLHRFAQGSHLLTNAANPVSGVAIGRGGTLFGVGIHGGVQDRGAAYQVEH
jgi:hypothetical protein